MEVSDMKSYYQFCEDERINVRLEGMPVHKFFAPEGFMLWGLEPKVGNFKGYAQIVDMPIEEFIGLAEPIPEDDEKRHAPQEDFKRDVLNGKSTNWDIPYLVCKENEDEEGEKSESISLDNTRYIGVEIRKTITGKYEVIFGRSVLCKCDHHLKARAVANAMTRGAVHFAMKRKIDAVMSGGFSIDKIM